MRLTHFTRALPLSAAWLLSACQSLPFTPPGHETRISHAQMIAQRAQLKRHDVRAGAYTLASWQKITAPGAPIHLYIEGDGLAWISKRVKSSDPTPTKPVALELAAVDNAPNVVYLARPCQYVSLNAQGCTNKLWTSERFTPEVMQSYNAALEMIKAQTQTSAFQITGFSGGGNIAAVLAGSRDDIMSLRTVAGNLDIKAFNTYHRTSPMPLSISAAEQPGKLKNVPQIHYIGGDDEIVPKAIYQSYMLKLGHSACIQSHVISGAAHEEGWTAHWPALLEQKPACH